MSKIEKCDDGKFRWIYEFKMMKNPIILLTTLKIFALVLLGMWLIFGLTLVKSEGGVIAAYTAELKELAIPAVILFSLSLISHLILAGIYGWKYIVLFEMDEEGVRHIHMEKQYKKAEALGWLTAMAGAFAGNLTTTGAGLLSATKNETYSEFSKTKKMKVLKAFHTIKLDAPLCHNQVYADDEDFEFVKNYIAEHIEKRK